MPKRQPYFFEDSVSTRTYVNFDVLANEIAMGQRDMPSELWRDVCAFDELTRLVKHFRDEDAKHGELRRIES